MMRDREVPVYRDKNWLYERYVLQQRQIREIAKEAGVSPTTISSWLKRYGLERPNGKFGKGVCSICGREFVKSGALQKYCHACSAERDRKRKLEWYWKHRDKAKEAARRRREKSRGQDRLVWEQVALERSLPPMGASEVLQYKLPNLRKRVWFWVPFARALSKNALWSLDPTRAHVYVRREVKRLKDQIAWQLRMLGIEWYQGKIWIDIFVEKPDNRSDAINLIDVICDAVKEGIGIDDRWFSIRRVDWRVVKHEPRIWIGVGQEIEEHHLVCSCCGRILPLEEFPRHKGGPFGKSRICRDCWQLFRRKKQELATKHRSEKTEGGQA